MHVVRMCCALYEQLCADSAQRIQRMRSVAHSERKTYAHVARDLTRTLHGIHLHFYQTRSVPNWCSFFIITFILLFSCFIYFVTVGFKIATEDLIFFVY